ncbi:MAG: metallophosphoesterase [Lentisphaeria bacterium]|nr:metallophosphoesterase [Lentisphaeria bacterium]
MKTRIIHFSDTHEPATLEHWHGLCDKRLMGWMNSSVVRKGRYNRDILPRAIEYILQNPPDLVVFTGDATSCGQPGEFARALKLFRPLLKTDIPFFYVPGNHDAYVSDKACQDALQRFTRKMSRGKYGLEDYPLTIEFPTFRLLLIHCAKPFNPLLSCGFMTPETREFLLKEAARLEAKPLICAGHFPLITQSSIINFRRRLYGSSAASALVQDGVIALSLCGHIHTPYELLDSNGRGEIIAGSLTKNGSLAEITFDSEQNRFSLQRISLR